MVRAAAKNWPHVGVVVDPADYAGVLAELDANGGALGDATRFRLMRKAFAHTASYDGAIANWLTARGARRRGARFPDSFHFAGDKVQDMRYGENPHQSRGVLSRRGAGAAARIADVPAAAGQGAVVQQRRRQRRRVGVRQDVRRARVRHRQARESLRRRHRRDAARRLSQARSPPIRRRRSAASSRSTGRSTPRRSKRSPRSSSKW